MTPRTWLGVAGWPVAHSRSPEMHHAALRAAGLHEWRYVRLPLPPALFPEAVGALARHRFRGINVTIPHKEAALALATEATATATAVGAANTLTFEPDGAIHADNTDVPGLLDVLPPAAGRTALVLGAGGAGRAAVYALREAGADVAIWNRTAARAQALADEFGVRAVSSVHGTDIVVNCTSVGLAAGSEPFKELPLTADDLGAGSCVVDMVYRAGGTSLLQAARAAGAETVDGLEVLVAQGAASFVRWTGRHADLQAMREAVDLLN